MSKKIEVIEVGPRDGFQSVKADCSLIPTEEKLKVIDELIASGVQHMEFTSFVSPKAIPQLADAAEVTKTVLDRYPQADLFALVPNLRGAQNAYALGLRKVCYVVSLSKSHNKANINRTHEQSLQAYQEIRRELPDLNVIVDLATTFGCPFEGKYEDPDQVVAFLKDYMDAGMNTCCLCDTIGIADPAQVRRVISALQKAYPSLELMVHFHDTRGLGMVNTLTAIDMGVTKVQSALGGLPLRPRRLRQFVHRGPGLDAQRDGLRHRHHILQDPCRCQASGGGNLRSVQRTSHLHPAGDPLQKVSALR